MKIDLSTLKRFALDKSAPGMFETSGGKFVRFDDVKKLVEEAEKSQAMETKEAE